MSDEEVIAGILVHDREAIRELVDRHHGNIIRTANGFAGNIQDAEDISQEVFMEIIRSIRHFRRTASLNTWIYRITVNKSLDFIRKRKRREFIQRIESVFPGGDGRKDSHSDPSLNTLPDPEKKENARILEKTIDTLPRNQRIVFVLCRFDDLSYREASEIMGISVSSVESLMYRAKMNLQKRLANHFPEYLKK